MFGVRAPRGRRVVILSAGAVVLASSLTALPAAAATVYELTGEWEPGTTGPVAAGDVLLSEWHFNLNDDAPAPGNEPVDDVTITFTAVNARFAAIPPVCRTDGDPVSAISPDRTVLTCNVGTRPQGTAEVIRPSIVVSGPPGAEVDLTAVVADRTVSLPELLIEGEFAMDFLVHGGSPVVHPVGDDASVVSFPWALRHGVGGPPGESTLTWSIDVSLTSGEAIEPVAPTIGDACVAQTRRQADYPYSDPAVLDERTTRFPSCTVEFLAGGVLELTLTGLDYGITGPVSTSGGVALPGAWNYIAAGELRIQFADPAAPTDIAIEVAAITYSESGGGGLTAADDTSNNENATLVPVGAYFGGWRADWMDEPHIGTPWEDTTRSMRGEEMLAISGVRTRSDTTVVICSVYDTKYVDIVEAAVGRLTSGTEVPVGVPGVQYRYFVGDGPGGIMNPASDDYDPNAFRCDEVTEGWTDTRPEDISRVRAVMATISPTVAVEADWGGWTNLLTLTRMRDDVEVGDDVWFWSSFSWDGGATWFHPHRDDDVSNGWTPTQGLRYAYAYAGRDVLRIVGAMPAITKTVSDEVTVPGATVEYTIIATPEARIDGIVGQMTVVDYLPAGMTYVPDSATSTPVASTPTLVGDTLTWEFTDHPANQPVVITFEATLPPDAAPDAEYVNTATNTVDGMTLPAWATTRVQDGGFTSLRKSTDTPLLELGDGGVVEHTWTIRLTSHDAAGQAFTDTIDLLPRDGDDRGSDFAGDYELVAVDVSEFQCEFCLKASGAILQVHDQLGDQLRYVWRHAPLTRFHPNALAAAEASEAAALQGRFFEFERALFDQQDDQRPSDLVRRAAEIGLDVERFERDLESPEVVARVRDDMLDAEEMQVTAVPTFFVNGRRHMGPYDAQSLIRALQASGPDPTRALEPRPAGE